ncbi:MAG: 1-acyl-sn-glycerol-3-phosphate acyltransferase, partial [Myxococcales bacterium]
KVKDVNRVAAEMAQTLALGIPVTVFLEGKASPGAEVLPFRPSLLEVAVRQQVRCVPVSVHLEAPHPSLPPSQTLAWWGDMAFLPHLLQLFSLKRVDATVTFGEPVAPGADRKALAATLQERVRSGFVPLRQKA